MGKNSFHDYVVNDALFGIHGIASRAMFGGWALYKNGLTFGIIADDELFFKVDDTNRKEYQELGSGPFVYESRGRKVTMKSYWRVPGEILDDRQELVRWVERSCRAAKRRKKELI